MGVLRIVVLLVAYLQAAAGTFRSATGQRAGAFISISMRGPRVWSIDALSSGLSIMRPTASDGILSTRMTGIHGLFLFAGQGFFSSWFGSK